MTTSLSSWLDGLLSVQLAFVCCLFFIAITLIGIVLIHPLMLRLIHGCAQPGDCGRPGHRWAGRGEPHFTRGQIAGGPYGLSADVPSFGVTAILMTTANMDSRVVAEFAKSLTSQIDTLKKRHPVLESLSSQAISPHKLPAPLHPAVAQANSKLGAAK